ncbi:MAG TPA: hypothetical protein VLA58_10470 [Chitinophagaceae bacterium]|nr:hypothetical protein [Chitinophagaceae bacterium]
MRLLNITAIACLLILGCGEEPVKQNKAKTDPYPLIPAIAEKDLNITVLIDLSDRINSTQDIRQPVQADRDISIINVLTSTIRKNVSAHGSFKSKARFNVYFHPEPADKEIRTIAKNLSAVWVSSNDMTTARQNKITYQSLEGNFAKGLGEIYSLAQASGKYPGSDIWRFMKDEAKLKCTEPDSSYRNILVILTDGYLYYENGKQQQPNSNRFNYIERGTKHFARFRNADLLLSEFDKNDFGLIPATTGLENLEILVLECRPEESWPQDFDIMQRYWCKWFREMGVRHAEIYKSQQPAYHEKIIAGFLSKRDGVCQ